MVRQTGYYGPDIKHFNSCLLYIISFYNCIVTLHAIIELICLLRDLLTLPCHLGGMGIANPINIADSQFDALVKVTAPLKELIMDQSLTASPPDLCCIKVDVHSHHCSVVKARAQEVYAKLSQPLQRAMDLNSEKGSSSWLTVLPFCDQGFHLTKREFWDATHL